MADVVDVAADEGWEPAKVVAIGRARHKKKTKIRKKAA